MNTAIILLVLHASAFIAASFTLALTLIVFGMLTAALVGLLMNGSPRVKAGIEGVIVITGIAVAAMDLPGQALTAGLFAWIYLEILRSDLEKLNLKPVNNNN